MTLYNSRPDFSILLIPYHKLLLFFLSLSNLIFLNLARQNRKRPCAPSLMVCGRIRGIRKDTFIRRYPKPFRFLKRRLMKA